MGDTHSRSARLVAKRAAKSTSLTPSGPQGSDPEYVSGRHESSDTDIVITPPPKSKRARSESSENDSDDSVGKKNKKSKKKKKKVAVEPTALDPDRSIQHRDSTRKNPVLSYKLSNATAKAPAINLTSKTDWEGCLEEVADTELKKKVKVSVSIHVTEQCWRSAERQEHAQNQKGRNARKMPILDLEHAGLGDDDFDNRIGIMEKELKFLEQLQNHHGRCQLCGPSKACKIDRAANHHNLTNNQLRRWARSLAAGTHQVTLSQPPRDELFGMFHKNTGNTPAAGTPAALPGMPYMGMPPYFMPPWSMGAGAGQFGPGAMAFPGSPATPTPRPSHAPHASTSMLSAALPSSDPPDMGALNPYTDIPEFIKQLHEYHPKRRLLDYVNRFGDLDFYNIDEVAKVGSAEDLSSLIGITHGNAAFLLGKIKDEMKRIDRAVRG